MTFEVTIDGTSVEIKANSLRISQTANGRATASFTIISQDRTYRPGLRDEVLMDEDGTRIFGGLIDRITERGMFKGSHPGILITVSAVDFNAYAERRYVNETIPAGTLKAALEAVDDYLTPYGVTLDAGQVNGPNLPDLAYDYKRLDEVLNDFAKLTADFGEPYVWDISPTKVLRMYQPSTETAPFDLTGNDLPQVIGDIEVETTLNPGYANKVIVKLSPKTEMARVDTFTYGVDPYPYVLSYTLFGHRGYVTHEGVFETLRLFGDPAAWTFDTSTNALTRDAGTPTAGQVTSINYDGTFAGTYEATDSSFATDPWEVVLLVDSIPDGVTAQAFADAELARRLSDTQKATYHTWEQGIIPGQQQGMTVSARDVAGPVAMVSDVEVRDLVHRLDRRVTVVTDSAQTNLTRGWRDVYKAWLGDKTGGVPTTTVGSGTVAQVGPGAPDESVQSNQGGAFSGKSSFLFKASGDSVILGPNNTISAANYVGCLIVGEDNEIAD